MSVLDAFLATWADARATFGAGAPEGGRLFDGSDQLRQLQSDVESAAPGARWSGTASTAYGTANQEHARILNHLADLEQRLAAHVDRSAEVVATGRQDLDAVRAWVLDMASSVPQNQAGQQMLVPIVKKGISQVAEIVRRSNGELNTIGGQIHGIAGEYQALSSQKFSQG